MPLKVLDCEICGRKGSVIPCVNAEWCQHGRCLKCHTSILGHKKFYARVNDSILTCESCVAYGDGCVVDDDDIEGLQAPHAAVPAKRSSGCKQSNDQHKRLCVTESHHDASMGEQKRLVEAVPMAADSYKESQPLPPVPPGMLLSTRVTKQQPSTCMATEREHSKQSPKSTGVKRSARSAADQPASKRLASNARFATSVASQQQPPMGNEKLEDEQPQPKSTKPQSRRKPVEKTSSASKAALLAPGHTSTSAKLPTNFSQNAAAVVLAEHGGSSGRKSAPDTSQSARNKGSLLEGSQQGVGLGSRLPEGPHARAQYESNSSKTLMKCGSGARGLPAQHKPSTAAHAAALLEGRVKLGRAQQVQADSSSVNTTSKGDEGEHQRASKHIIKQGSSDVGVIATNPNDLRRRAEERKKTHGHDPGTQNQAPPRKVFPSSNHNVNMASTQSAAPHAPHQSFQLHNAISAVKFGQACSDDGEHDADQELHAGGQPGLNVPLQSSHSMRPRKAAIPSNTDAWVGRASIAADDVLEIDMKVMPGEHGVALPPLLQLLKVQQGTEVDGSLVTTAVMDKWALKESGQGGVATLTTRFDKLLVVLKERAFGQDKQLHTLIRQMMDQRKYLRLNRGGQSVYFSPVLREQSAATFGMELVDYNRVAFHKHEDAFEQVYDDQLGVVYHLNQGEELPTCKSVQFAEEAPGAGGEASFSGGGWNRNQVAQKSNLKKDPSMEVPVRAQVTIDEASILATQPVTTSEVPLVGDDDDWLESEGGVFASGQAGPSREGSLGLGLGPHQQGSVGFMATEDGQDVHVHPVGARHLELGKNAHSRQPWGATEGLSQALAPGAGLEHRPSAEVSKQVSPNTSEPALNHNIAPATLPASTTSVLTAPHQQATAVTTASSQSLIGNVLERAVSRKKLLLQLMPGLQGLCDYIRRCKLNGVKVHIDGSLIDDLPDQARSLRDWARSQGATVTMFPDVPNASNVNLLVVSHQRVIKAGMEGTSSGISINKWLVEGVHVVSELFMDDLRQSNLALRAEVVERDKAKHYRQFFASGVILLWDESLLAHAPITQLKQLVAALKAAAKHMGSGHGFYKAYVRSSAREKHPRLGPLLKAWRDENIVLDLPLDYTSTTPKTGVPDTVRDASKAIFVINREKGPLRYMVIVVPDALDDMDVDTKARAEFVKSAAASHRTIYAAALSETMRLLDIFANSRN